MAQCFLRKTLLRKRDDGLFPVIVPKKTVIECCICAELQNSIVAFGYSAPQHPKKAFRALFQPMLMKEGAASHIISGEMNHLTVLVPSALELSQ